MAATAAADESQRWLTCSSKVFDAEGLTQEEKAAVWVELVKNDLSEVERTLTVQPQHLADVLRKYITAPPAAAPSTVIGTRNSDDGSNAHKGSPPKGSAPKTTTETKTVALTDKGVSIHDRFPNLSQAGPVEVECRLEPSVRSFLLECMILQAGGMIKGSLFSSEAAYVHLARPMLMTVIALLGPELNTRLLPDEQDQLVQDIAEGTEGRNCKLAYEQWIRAGSFNGYIELQVVRPAQPSGFHYAGAVEVKKGDDLSSHLEQAKREAFTMWCFNAQQQQPSYEPTWVILTNTRQLMRVMFTGYNVPKDLFKTTSVEAAPVYRKKMPTKEVYGRFEFSHVYNLLSMSVKGLLGCRDSEEALEVLVSGFLKRDKLPTLETLKQRYQDFTTDITSIVANYMEDVEAIRASVTEGKAAKRQRLA